MFNTNFSQTLNKTHTAVTERKEFKPLSIKLELDNNSKNLLNKYIISELEFYNILIDQLSAAANRHPETFINLSEEQIYIFSDLCLIGKTVDEAKKDPKFIDVLELLNSIPENLKIIFEVAKVKFSGLPYTKKIMSYEILTFFKEYCSTKKSKNVTGIATLSKYTIFQKRHIQIPRKECKIVFNKEKNISELFIPHLLKPICSINGNLNSKNWSIVIIHQKSNINPNANTEWLAEFKPSKYNYIIKYLDKKW